MVRPARAAPLARGWAFASALLLVLLSGSCSYVPAPVDCRIHCALDGTCPMGMVCSVDYCRPVGHPSTGCGCSPGEERTCGSTVGECRAGTQQCATNRSWSECMGLIRPVPELCDGKDNDCDGKVDNDPADAPLCELSKGVCEFSVHACVNGRFTASCRAEYGSDFEPVETRCDGFDNDCDGTVDGRFVGKVADSSLGYDLVGLDGGYVLVYGTAAGPGRAYFARFFDVGMNALGPPVSLATTSTATSVSAAGAAGRAWFLWQHSAPTVAPAIDEAGGASVELSNPAGTPSPLSGLPRPDMRGAIKIGANAKGLVAAYPTDGGVGILEWPIAGGPPSARRVAPPLSNLAEVYEVGLSTRGTSLTMATKLFTDDAGTTDYFDGLLSLIDGGYSSKFVYAGATIVDSPKGAQAIYDGFCDYNIFGFQCHKSYVVVDFDIWNAAAPPTIVRLGAVSAGISGAHATATSVDWVASWVESNLLYVGTSPMALAIRSARVSTVPAPVVTTRIANAGVALNAVVYNADRNTGQLNAVLICPP